MNLFIFAKIYASLAQLVEQLIRNEQVVGSSPIGGSEYVLNAISSFVPTDLRILVKINPYCSEVNP
jgi:hypothetical protein